jgi:glycerol-3-phosphate dehydrogenase
MLYFANTDGRICIFYPFYGKVIAGSTDIPVANPESAICDEGEVGYILNSMRQVFPAIHVDRSHIIYRFCGVRPLPRSDSSTPGEVSRDHSCAVIPPGSGINFPVYSLIGGKWTTFRAFGEQVADRILKHLARPRRASSADLPIGGGKRFPTTAFAKGEWLVSLHTKTHLPMQRLEVLLDRYGTRAEGVALFMCDGPDRPLRWLPECSQREIQYVASQEIIVHLDDLVLRRSIMALLGQLTQGLLEELAFVVAPVLAWPEKRVQQEIERTVKILREVHGVILPECGKKP